MDRENKEDMFFPEFVLSIAFNGSYLQHKQTMSETRLESSRVENEIKVVIDG